MQRIHDIRQQLLSRKNSLGFCFLTVFLWGFLAHGYAFLNTFLSHDLLNAFSATQAEELWKLELGRFFVPVYRFIFRNPVYLPWVIGILGLVWIALSLFFLTETFEIRSKALLVFIAGVMTTNITVIAQIATYAYEFDANAFSLLFSILTVCFWRRSKGFLSVAAGSICLFVSIGIYQAFIAVTATLMLFRLIPDLLDGEELRPVLLRGLKGLLILSLGLLLYFAGSRVVAALWGITLQDRISFVAEGGLFSLLQQILPAMYFLLVSILHPAYQSKAFLFAVSIVILLLGASVLRLFAVKKFPSGRILSLFLPVGLLPFGMTCVYFAAKGVAMHDLTKYAVWFFYIFILFFAFRLCKKDMLPGALPRIYRAAACLLIGAMLWQNVLLANTAYMKKEREADAALSAMTRVVSMIENSEDYTPGETKVAFMGTLETTPAPYGTERASVIAGLSPTAAIPGDTSVYYYNAYKAYCSYVLQCPLLFCEDAVHAALKQDMRVAALPAFPNKDCIEMIDGVLVVKMGP